MSFYQVISIQMSEWFNEKKIIHMWLSGKCFSLTRVRDRSYPKQGNPLCWLVKRYFKYTSQFSVSIKKKTLEESVNSLAACCSSTRMRSELSLESTDTKVWKTEFSHLCLGYLVAFHRFVKLKLKMLETLDLIHAFEYEHWNSEKIRTRRCFAW